MFYVRIVMNKFLVTESARSNDDSQPSTSRGGGDAFYRKKSKDDKKNANWRDYYQIIEPPALLSHCPEVQQLHPDGQM